MAQESVQIIGRSSSHYTRVALFFARELAVPFELVPIYDLTQLDRETFAGNPALKLPSMRRGGSTLFGTENICRALADMAPEGDKKVVWPEQLGSVLARNAQELVWHGFASQVTLVLGTVVHDLPADNPFFVKVRAGFEGALGWLNENVDEVVTALDHTVDDRKLSLLEVSLFCLATHLQFRPTVPPDSYPKLISFVDRYGRRPAAQATSYRFDQLPSEANR